MCWECCLHTRNPQVPWSASLAWESAFSECLVCHTATQTWSAIAVQVPSLSCIQCLVWGLHTLCAHQCPPARHMADCCTAAAPAFGLQELTAQVLRRKGVVACREAHICAQQQTNKHMAMRTQLWCSASYKQARRDAASSQTSVMRSVPCSDASLVRVGAVVRRKQRLKLEAAATRWCWRWSSRWNCRLRRSRTEGHGEIV